MSGRPKVITLKTYVRNLPWSIFNFIASELDTVGNSTSWRDFVVKIPISSTNSTPRFSMNDIRKFENLVARGESPTIAIIDAWATFNCNAEDLLNVLQSLNLHSSAEQVKKLISPLPRYEEVLTSPPPYRHPSDLETSYTPNFHQDIQYRRPIELESIAPSVDNREISCRIPVEHDETDQTLKSSTLMENVENSKVSSYSYFYLLEVTDSFAEKCKLGEGAFGCVFKGSISSSKKANDSNKTVAIKRLKLENAEKSQALIDQFQKEVHVISKLEHPNILPLLGYSFGGPELCLVYRFMVNGSLNYNLAQCRSKTIVMNYQKRCRIAEGSACGINYLHQQNIIHRDIKSSNILLDQEMNPQISDFGLIRSLGGSNNQVLSTQTSNPIGTLVYMAPEGYLGTITLAMDVFSFGVVLLELLTGMEVIDATRDPLHLTLYVDEVVDDDEIENEILFDTSANSWGPEWGHALLDLALKCLKYKYKQRPEMSKVYETITNITRSTA